jgi:hypothetical protein
VDMSLPAIAGVGYVDDFGREGHFQQVLVQIFIQGYGAGFDVDRRLAFTTGSCVLFGPGVGSCARFKSNKTFKKQLLNEVDWQNTGCRLLGGYSRILTLADGLDFLIGSLQAI